MSSFTSIRPSNVDGAFPYFPHRDLTNIYLPSLRAVFLSLDQANWPGYLAEVFERNGITEEALAEGAKRFADAHRLFIGHGDIQTPAAALERAEFTKVAQAIQIAIYERLGRLLVGEFFTALRDATPKDDFPPQMKDLAEMVAAGETVLYHSMSYPRDPDKEAKQAYELEKYKCLWEKGHKVFRKLRERLISADAKYVALKRAASESGPAPLTGWRPRLCAAWKMLRTGNRHDE